MREVPGSNPGQAHFFLSFFLPSLSFPKQPFIELWKRTFFCSESVAILQVQCCVVLEFASVLFMAVECILVGMVRLLQGKRVHEYPVISELSINLPAAQKMDTICAV